jgi:hypothetical protein
MLEFPRHMNGVLASTATNLQQVSLMGQPFGKYGQNGSLIVISGF